MALIEMRDSQDEVLAEVRRIKDEIGQKFDFDLRKMWEDIKKAEAESGRQVLTPPRDSEA